MKLSSFKGKGRVHYIGKIKSNENFVYLQISVEMEFSKQILDFYLTETSSTPPAFKIINKNFTGNGSYKVGEEIQFDFNIVKNANQETKLKIWSVYNKKI